MNEKYIQIIEEKDVHIKLLREIIDSIRDDCKDNELDDNVRYLSLYLVELAEEIKSCRLSENYIKQVLYDFTKALISINPSDDVMAGVI
jgi:hypothetical protein